MKNELDNDDPGGEFPNSKSIKKLKIAFLYNVRNNAPSAIDPSSQLDIDFDEPEIIERMIREIEAAGYEVFPIEADENAYQKLFELRNEIDLAFNYSEGLYGADREAQIPSMLEMLKIPYTGSTPFSQSVVLNKARTKTLLEAGGVSTLQSQVFFDARSELFHFLKDRFPLIVKPVSHGSSGGIINNSVVKNEDELREKVAFILENFGQGALVEPFVTGREFSVAMLGNPLEILGIVELNHHHLPTEYMPMASLEVKFFLSEDQGRDYLTCPADVNSELGDKLRDMALRTCELLEIRDWCRLDIRCDEKENPYLLEVNSPASLEPPDHQGLLGYCSYTLAADRAGMNYQQLLNKIISTSLKRYEPKIAN